MQYQTAGTHKIQNEIIFCLCAFCDGNTKALSHQGDLVCIKVYKVLRLQDKMFVTAYLRTQQDSDRLLFQFFYVFFINTKMCAKSQQVLKYIMYIYRYL